MHVRGYLHRDGPQFSHGAACRGALSWLGSGWAVNAGLSASSRPRRLPLEEGTCMWPKEARRPVLNCLEGENLCLGWLLATHWLRILDTPNVLVLEATQTDLRAMAQSLMS